MPLDTSYSIDWEPGSVLLDEFIIERILGHGGMGKVYLVKSTVPGGEVFAVKTLLDSSLKNDTQRRLILRELRTWIDLPDHPNITACRFFRTIGDRLAIFSEYIPNGSLKDWIKQKPARELVEILDIAIQSAWGIQAAHDQGVIHQDIKPANILMGCDNVPKITDFGLANAAKFQDVKEFTGSSLDSFYVSSRGMTIAYCSPEQAKGMKLGRKTDMWSWGLAVLEMFVGEVSWRLGVVARDVLKNYAEEPNLTKGIPIPDAVLNVLGRCFAEEPIDRYPTMRNVADAMIEVFEKITGNPYPRTEPAYDIQKTYDSNHFKRWVLTGSTWEDPVIWLKRAVSEAGLDYKDFETSLPERSGSLKAQALIDLEIVEETEKILKKLMKSGRNDVALLMAYVMNQKAFVLTFVQDIKGALSAHENAIGYLNNARQFIVDDEAELLLARTYLNAAVRYKQIGRKSEAVDYLQHARTIFERVSMKSTDESVYLDLSKTCINIASCLDPSRQTAECLELIQKSCDICADVIKKSASVEARRMWAITHMHKCIVCLHADMYSQSNEAGETAASAMENLIDEDSSPKMQYDLALIYINYAVSLGRKSNNDKAIELYKKADAILEELTQKQGREDCYFHWASTMLNMSMLQNREGNIQESIDTGIRCREILEDLVFRRGRGELSEYLAMLYNNLSFVYANFEAYEDAMNVIDKAVELRKNQKWDLTSYDLTVHIARLHNNKSDILKKEGKLTEALMEYETAIEMLETLMSENKIDDYLGNVADMQIEKAEIYFNLGQLEPAFRLVKQYLPILEQEAEKYDFEDFRHAARRIQTIMKKYQNDT